MRDGWVADVRVRGEHRADACRVRLVSMCSKSDANLVRICIHMDTRRVEYAYVSACWAVAFALVDPNGHSWTKLAG